MLSGQYHLLPYSNALRYFSSFRVSIGFLPLLSFLNMLFSIMQEFSPLLMELLSRGTFVRCLVIDFPGTDLIKLPV